MPIRDNVTELHDVAEALLQLHSGHRGSPAATDAPKLSPRDHNMETESAAKLLLSCLAMPRNKTRDQETQTDQTLDPTLIKLYERIHSLEDQLRNLRTSALTTSPTAVVELDPDVSTDVLQIQSFGQFIDNSSNNKKSKKCTARLSNATNKSFKDDETSDGEWRSEEHKYDTEGFRDTPRHKCNDMVPIGEGYARVPKRLLKQIDWNSYTGATRKLLTAVFSRRVLATHSLTGKPSPAFPDKPAKKPLQPELVNDIVQIVVDRCGVPESVVRTSITTKCADESKMFRTRQQNRKKSNYFKKDQENVSPSSHENSFDE